MDNQRIVDDINVAERAGAYMSAMALALTIPDICMGNKSTREDYIDWVQTYYVEPDDSFGITGEELYALRCSFLHQHNANINIQPVLKGAKPKKFLLRFPQKPHAVSMSVFLRDPQESKDTININATLVVHKMLIAYGLFLRNNPKFRLSYDGISFEGDI